MDWLDTVFVSIIGLIVLTMVVYYIFQDLYPPTVVPSRPPVPPPPPPTTLTPLPTPEPEPPTTYVPLYTRSSLARNALHLDGATPDPNDPRFPFQEGFGFEDFFSILGDLFKLALVGIYILVTFPAHIIEFGKGFLQLGVGVIHLFEGFIEQLIKIFDDSAALLGDITRCGLTWAKNLRICALWYIVDMALYALIAIFFWVPIYIIRILTFGKVDLNPLYLSIFGCSDANPAHKMRDIDGKICHKDGIMEKVDQGLHKRTGLHFMHFPDEVLTSCYGCDVVGDTMTLLYDSTFGLLTILEQPIEDVWDAGKHFWKAFYLDKFF
jgi:hypothetical protein